MKKNRKGFTLVELIVVVAILGVLMAVLVPQYIQYIEKSRAQVCSANINTVIRYYEISRSLQKDADPQSLFDEAAAACGLTKNSGVYSNGCPSKGTYTVKFDPVEIGKLSGIECNKHGLTLSGKNAAEALAEAVYKAIELDTSFKNYMNRAGSSVDSLGGKASGQGGYTNTVNAQLEALGYSLSKNSIWKVYITGSGNYNIFYTELTDNQLSKIETETVEGLEGVMISVNANGTVKTNTNGYISIHPTDGSKNYPTIFNKEKLWDS